MDHDLEFRHLRYFIAVAEELHFGRAAARLHLAQPPLSQQIRKLEEILGYPLFTRTSRVVRLTSAGEIFLERARRTLRSVHEDIAEARSVGRGEAGFLRVGYISSGMLTQLPAMLGSYRKRYPNVQLQLHESVTSGVTRGLATGALDAGILRDPDATEGIHTEVLFSEPYVAVLPAQHPLAGRKAISAGALRDESFVFFSRTAGPRAYDKTAALCELEGFRPRIMQEAPQWLSCLRLIGAGFGVTIAPACVRQVATKDVVCLPIRSNHPGQTPQSTVELAFRANEDRPIVQAFAEIARRSFAQRYRPAVASSA
jgi:DNA-binding transcriptional LysR family regulator